MVTQLNLPAMQIISIASIAISFVFMMIAILCIRKAKRWEKEFWELKKIMDQLERHLNETDARFKSFIDKR